MADNQRDYIGYEDYTPAGRAAIDAFNNNKGPHYLKNNSDMAAYTKAKLAAESAANNVLAEEHRSKETALSILNEKLGFRPSPPQIAPPIYFYPPRDSPNKK